MFIITVLDQSSLCTVDGEVHLRDQTNTISSQQLSRLPCFQTRPPGASHWTLHVKASPGQIITLSLLDFEYTELSGGHSCVSYGHVTDSHTKQTASLCGRQARLQEIFTSNSNALDLRLNIQGEMANFALQMDG